MGEDRWDFFSGIRQPGKGEKSWMERGVAFLVRCDLSRAEDGRVE